MKTMIKALLLPAALMALLSGAAYCAETVTSEVLLNGRALTGAENIVLFAKLNKVIVVNLGESAQQKKYELFGRVEYKKDSETFDRFYSSGSKFSMKYSTETTLESQSLTFTGCKVYKKDKAAGLVIYRIKADGLK